jgi:serine/threonine protein kinase
MLIGKRQEILLSDFGIAVMAQSSRYQNAQDMAGTITYMAPEQIQGKPRPSSDQYSLGIVIYEWLSGTRPFQGSLTEMVGQHLSVIPSPLREKLPTISPAVEEVVMRALAKDPKERFTNVSDLAIALERASQPTQTEQSSIVVLSSDRLSTTPNEAVTPPNQTSKEELLSGALKLLETDNYAKALTTLNTLLSIDPDLAYAQNAKGLSLYHLKQYSEALTSLDRAIALNSNDTTARYGRGLVLEKLKRFADALLEYDQVTRFDATHASAWRQKGNVLSEMKRYEEALKAYEKALQLNQNDADAYIGKGNVLKYLGRLK